MKRLCILIAAAAALCCTAGAEAPTDSTAVVGPRFAVADRHFDMGLFEEGESRTLPLTVYNRGDEPLAIVNIFTECGCTTTQFERTPVAPGDSTVINITYDSRGRGTGEFMRLLRIRTNDSTSSPYTLFVEGRVKQPVKRTQR